MIDGTDAPRQMIGPRRRNPFPHVHEPSTQLDWIVCPELLPIPRRQWIDHIIRIDVDALRARLTRAQLVLGDVADTTPEWIEHGAVAPIGFASFDLDLYSSTVDALAVLETSTDRLLPRIHCYFDDTTGFTYGDLNGERRAIAEFNEKNDERKVSPLYALRHYVPARCANDLCVHKFWLAHILDHPLYGEPDGLTRVSQLPLSA